MHSVEVSFTQSRVFIGCSTRR